MIYRVLQPPKWEGIYLFLESLAEVEVLTPSSRLVAYFIQHLRVLHFPEGLH